MKDIMFKSFMVFIAVMLLGTGLTYLTGYNKVLFTKTVVKAQQNAEREVFEETQSYVEGKRQEALKLFKEYSQARGIQDKEAICDMVSMSFANFDENKLPPTLARFVYNCKYN